MLFDFATLSAQDRYKLLASTVVPRPIAWMVTQDQQGRLNAAPFSFFNVFGRRPAGRQHRHRRPQAGDARTPATTSAQPASSSSTSSGTRCEQMNITAIEFAAEVDEIAEAGLTTAPSTKVKPPRIAESPVALECSGFMLSRSTTTAPSCSGEVLAMHVSDDCMSTPRG